MQVVDEGYSRDTKENISGVRHLFQRLLDDPVIGQQQFASASGNDGEQSRLDQILQARSAVPL